MSANSNNKSSWTSLLQTCLVLIIALCILVPDDVRGAPTNVLANEKRGGSARRYPRARYRVGYMFGKRSSSMVTSSKLFEAVSRKLISLTELSRMLKDDPEILEQVISHLDKNGDGFLTVSDLL